MLAIVLLACRPVLDTRIGRTNEEPIADTLHLGHFAESNGSLSNRMGIVSDEPSSSHVCEQFRILTMRGVVQSAPSPIQPRAELAHPVIDRPGEFPETGITDIGHRSPKIRMIGDVGERDFDAQSQVFRKRCGPRKPSRCSY